MRKTTSKAIYRENLFAGAWFIPTAAFFGMCVLLLAIPYSYGVGTVRFSLAELLWQTWSRNEEMQHGFLVLPAIAVIIWMQRARFREITPSACWLGIPVLLFGLLVYYTGYRADIFTAGQLGLWLSIFGSTLWLFGWPAFRILIFPILFLLFAFPLPGGDALITFPLRMVMSNASVAVLNGIGIDVVRQGTGILSAPDPLLGIPAGKRFSVDVADPCSGIRSLFALMMVSALYGHFTLKTWWQKWILFALSVPLAVLGNLIRILMLTVGTMVFGAEFAIGKDALNDPSWFHMGAGYVVFAVALGGMVGVSNLLQFRLANWREKFDLKSLLAAPEKAVPAASSLPPIRTKKDDLY